MSKKFVEIDDAPLLNLEKIAKDNGFTSIEELLTAFAKNFSTRCSVTLTIGDFLAKKAVA